MYDRVLRQMREKIRTRQYVMTVHAEEEMANDNLSIFDVEHVILTGEIIERQKDRDTGEWKYLVEGETIAGDLAVVVAKLSVTNKLVMITVYVV
jgi:uncharacterized DUF497 family protein